VRVTRRRSLLDDEVPAEPEIPAEQRDATRRVAAALIAKLHASDCAAAPATSAPATSPAVIAETRAKLRGPAPARNLIECTLADARAAQERAWREKISRQRKRAKERERKSELQRRETAERLRLAALERDRRFKEESERRGVPEFRPKDLPPAAFEIAGRIDRHRDCAERELRGIVKRHRALGRCVDVAAHAMVREPDGTRRPRRSLASRRARRIVAVAAVLLYLAEEAKRTGYALLVEGYLRGSFCQLFPNPDNADETISLGSLFNTGDTGERGGRVGRWDCGAVVALERAGALEKVQPPASTQHACNVGVDRKGAPRALNQYFVKERAATGAAGDGDALEVQAEERWLRRRAARAAAEARPPPAG